MPRYNKREAREAVAISRSYSEVLRRLGMRPAGGNHALLRKYLDEIWRIPTDHFDGGGRRIPPVERVPLQDVLVENSTYSRSNLKPRLYEEGLKERRCEMCGQDEHWQGRTMSLILDHINGVPDDNRLENLRIVCPNCAASLDTHCGRKNRREPEIRNCRRCGKEFQAKYNALPRSKRRATAPSGANTGFPTTLSASGCGSTSGNESGRAWNRPPSDLGSALWRLEERRLILK